MLVYGIKTAYYALQGVQLPIQARSNQQSVFRMYLHGSGSNPIEFVDSGLYFVQDENNSINPLLQVDPDPDPLKKVPDQDPDPAGQKSTDPTESGSSSRPG